MRRIKICLFISFILFPLSLHSKTKVELLSKFNLDQTNEIIGRCWNIAVDEKENIYIPDMPQGNIKIYSKKGKLIRTVGKKGAGPGEFVSPMRVDVDNEIICVQDPGQFKYFIFDRNFILIGKFFYLISGSDTFVIDKNKLITNSYLRDKEGNEFKGVIFDFQGKTIKTLLPLPYPKDDAWNRITDSGAYIDISKEYIFLAKMREVKIFKFTKDGVLVKTFGKSPPWFTPCKKTKDFDEMIRWGRSPEGIKAGERWYSSFSWVSGLFVLEDFLGITIRKFNKKQERWECFLQFYDFEGRLLGEEIKLEETGYSSYDGFFLDSNHKDRIYILEIDEKAESPQYIFFIYKVGK